MKFLIALTLCLTQIQFSFAQKDYWSADANGVSFMLPPDWNADPFSTSSVCDCPGIISDNGEYNDSLYMGMVAYPMATEPLSNTDQQNWVWGYKFHGDSKPDEVTYNGIRYKRTYGKMIDDGEERKAVRYVSISRPKKNRAHLVIYFFGVDKVYDATLKEQENIMKSIKRRKFHPSQD